MDSQARTSRTRETWRLTFAMFAIVGVALVSMIAGALPASASELALSGVVACHEGDHVITWTITNTDSSNTVTITSALTAKDPLSYDVTGYSPTLAPGATTHGTTTIPGSATGVVVLYVYETWADFSGSDRTALDLGDACSVSTTTTTATTVVSTTTSVPTSTTTIVAAGSTVAATTTVVPTTRLVATTTTAAAAALPRTGGNSAPLAGIALGALTLGLAAVGLTRRTRVRQ
jgi:hypothetical protein